MIEALELRTYYALAYLNDGVKDSAAAMDLTDPGNPYNYLVPSEVVASARAAISAVPSQVIADAANAVVTNQSSIDTAMIDVIAMHERLSLSIYPDSGGVPTVGYGFNLQDPDIYVPIFGQSKFNSMTADWENTLEVYHAWVKKEHLTAGKLQNGKLWMKFIRANPNASPIEMSANIALELLGSVMPVFIQRAAVSFGTQFYKLDRDPQIGLVDMRYRGDTSKPLARAIAGSANENYSTNYITASKLVVSSPASRKRDDADLILHGTDVTSVNAVFSTTSLAIGGSESVAATALGAHGKQIALPFNQFKWDSSSSSIVITAQKGSDATITGKQRGAAVVSITVGTGDAESQTKILVGATLNLVSTITWQVTSTIFGGRFNGSYIGSGSEMSVEDDNPLEYYGGIPDYFDAELIYADGAGFSIGINFEKGTEYVGTLSSSYNFYEAPNQDPVTLWLLPNPMNVPGYYSDGSGEILFPGAAGGTCNVELTSYNADTGECSGTFTGKNPSDGHGLNGAQISGTFSVLLTLSV